MRKEFSTPRFLALLLCAFFVSCDENAAINKVLGVGAQAPVFISYKAASGTEIQFQFSVPVRVIEAYVDEGLEIEPFPIEYESTIALRFREDHSGGKSITADLLVEDENGNSLNLLVPVKTRNDRIPALRLNEVRTVYSNPSLEFIELYTKTAGNLGAMRLFAASEGLDEAVYEFPPAEVEAGEYITLHMRTKEGDTAIDELGDELNLSAAVESKKSDVSDTARDLWVAGANKLYSTDVIYLVDQDDNIIDALVMAETPDKWAKNNTFSKASEFLAKQGAWLAANGELVKSPGYSDAVVTAKIVNGKLTTLTTATRTICRYETKEDSNTMADWYICNTSKATPGKKNSTERYEGK
jgi:hypothetical protein